MSKEPKFWKKTFDLMRSREYVRLPSDAKVIYDYMRMAQWEPGNRADSIKMGYRDLPEGLVPRTNYYRAINQLIEFGFIAKVKDGGWPNRRTIYALAGKWR